MCTEQKQHRKLWHLYFHSHTPAANSIVSITTQSVGYHLFYWTGSHLHSFGSLLRPLCSFAQCDDTKRRTIDNGTQSHQDIFEFLLATLTNTNWIWIDNQHLKRCPNSWIKKVIKRAGCNWSTSNFTRHSNGSIYNFGRENKRMKCDPSAVDTLHAYKSNAWIPNWLVMRKICLADKLNQRSDHCGWLAHFIWVCCFSSEFPSIYTQMNGFLFRLSRQKHTRMSLFA